MTTRLLTLRDRLEAAEARLDAARRKCTTGYGCGSTCINVKKECRSEGGAAISKERIARLEQLSRGEVKPRGLGTPKPAEAQAMAEGLRSARGSKAQQLLGQRKATREAKAAEEAAKAAEAAAKAKAREAAKAKEAPAGTPRGEADRAAKAADPDIDRPYEAKRSKPKETIVFPEPIVGPNGAKLTAYTWQWTLTEDVDHRGEPVEKRVSDWEKSIANVETGRNVVHQFQVEVGGETRTVSAESALKLMGFLSETDRKAFGSLKSSARTVARLRMAQQELDQQEKRWQKDWDEVGAMPRPALEVGEWSEEPPGWPREGYRRRSWRAGEVQQDQIWNQLGVDTDQEQAAHIWARWKAVEMEKRGWDYKGQGQTAMRGYLRRNREDLAKRLARAEAKLMAQTRLDSALAGSDRIESLLNRINRLHRVGAKLVQCRHDAAMAKPDQEPASKPAAAKGEAGDGIDWANVASEARTMVELNRPANEAWQAMQQKGKQKPQDG